MGLALTDASRNQRTFRHNPAVFSRSQNHRKLHAQTLRRERPEGQRATWTRHPKEPGLSESERADTQGFLREMLRILPLLGVRVFEKPTAMANPGKTAGQAPSENRKDTRATANVPAHQDGLERAVLGQHCWFAIRIGGGMLSKIKCIAAYQSNPISAITTYAKVDRIEPYGDEGKYKLIFAEPAKPLPRAIPFADAPPARCKAPATPAWPSCWRPNE